MRYLKIILLLGFIGSIHANPDIYSNNFKGVVAIVGESSLGSGAIISKDGLVLTNWHVLDGQKNLKVFFADDINYEFPKDIRILKINKNKDLALIKIKSLRRKVNYFEISKKIPKVGDELHAIGHPEGEMWTYTKGYLNAYRLDYSAFEEASSSQKEENFFYSGDVFQTQIPIYPGNSGGPLLNNFGNIIGINTFTNPDYPAMSFAITNKEIIKFLLN